uniref:Tetratricopeptide repeat domain 23 n=1 Tax=Latimeria chalumnae TaxID=7897 RepID=H3ALG0_LATCH
SETSVPSYTPGINRRSARTRRKLRNGLVEAAIMQPPEDRLMESEMRAKVYITNQEADLAIKELVRCTALARICYGDHHWKLARAHSNLAKEYFHLKGLPIQAIEQAEKAHGILLAYSQLPASDEEKREFLRCLIAHFHTMGRVLTAQQKIKPAEQSLNKAAKVLEELSPVNGVSHEEVTKIKIELTLSYARLYQKQKRTAEAISNYQQALSLLQSELEEKCTERITVLRDMATAEQVQGDHESAIQHLLQAHSILLSKDPSREETAEIAHSLAQAYAASKKEGVNGVIEKYYEDSVSGYKEVLGLENSKCLAVLDDYCQFLILIGKHKQAAVLLLDSLESKKSTFGELSAEVAETYRLLGGIELAQGDQKRAHHKLKKCLEIQILLYGSQHAKTRASQQTLDLLSKSLEVVGKERKSDTLRERPPFCAVVPQHSVPGGVKTNIYD